MSHRLPLRARAMRMLCASLALVLLSTLAAASHFRFGHITWQRVQNGAPNEIDITLTIAWRAAAFEGTTLTLSGGGGSMCFNLPAGPGVVGCAPGVVMTDLGTFTDLQGEQYRIATGSWRRILPNEGPWTVTGASCCRIYSLINASGASWNITSVLDLRGGNQGSPVSSIPVILQVPINTLYSFPLPIADPDLDPVTVVAATSAQSGIPSTPMIGANPLTVSPGGVLNWNTNGGVIGNKYAYQVRLQENHPGGPAGDIVLDFILELVGPPPTCNGGGNFVVAPNQNFQTSFLGDHPSNQPLTFLVQGVIPPGAFFVPPPGTTSATPFKVDFFWTPTQAQANTAWALSVIFQDAAGAQSVCSLGISVPDDPSFQSPDCGTLITHSAEAQLTFNVTAQANTGQPGEFVTLAAVLATLPPGATLAPGPVVVGQPAVMTFDWTPSVAQIGSYVVTFTATDQLGQVTTCDVPIDVVECFLALAYNPGADSHTIGGHTFATQLGTLRESYGVALDDVPSFPIGGPAQGGSWLGQGHRRLNLGRLQAIVPVDQFAVQVLMWNPQVFPWNPEQSSSGLAVTVWSNGEVTAVPYGPTDGMTIRHEIHEDSYGTRYIRFPFTIEGL